MDDEHHVAAPDGIKHQIGELPCFPFVLFFCASRSTNKTANEIANEIAPTQHQQRPEPKQQ